MSDTNQSPTRDQAEGLAFIGMRIMNALRGGAAVAVYYGVPREEFERLASAAFDAENELFARLTRHHLDQSDLQGGK